MNRKLIEVCTICACIFSFSLVSADDAVGNPIFTAHTSKVVCVSVQDPKDMPSGYFLLFDYSSSKGTELGKPWSLVEKGKCYDIRDGGRLLIIRGGSTEKAQYANYKQYKPDTDILTKIEFDNYTGEPLYPPTVVQQLFPPLYDGDRDPLDVYSDTLYTANLIPTQYNFGDGITYTSSSYPTKELLEYYRKNLTIQAKEISDIEKRIAFVEDRRYAVDSKSIYESLATSLASTIQSCDNRSRVEYQIDIAQKQIHSLGKSENGTPVFLEEYSEIADNSLDFITYIGCKNAYIRYIASHNAEIQTLDTLADSLLKEYSPTIAESFIYKNENKQKINTYVSGTYTSEKAAPELLEQIRTLYNFPKEIHISTSDTNIVTALPQSTTIEEATPEKKMSIVAASKNKLFKIYTILPLVGVLIITGIIIYRKKKNVV